MEFKEVSLSKRLSKTVDKRKRNRKPYRSKSQQEYFIKLWQKSKLSRRVFCERYEINKKTFSAWLKKADVCPNEVAGTELTSDLNEQSQSTLLQEKHCVNLTFPNGLILNVTGKLEKQMLSTMIQEVSRCKFN